MSEKQMKRPTSANVPALQEGPRVQSDEMTIDLVELMYRLIAHWKLIVCLALVFAVAAGVWTTMFVTPRYRATSIIYVMGRKDSAINLSDLEIGTALTQDYIEVFNMWEVHEEVITHLGLPYSYGYMRGGLSVSNPTDTRLLRISFTSTSPEEAALIANEYASVASQYIADTMATDKPNIMSVALTPTSPVSPNRRRNILMGFMLGALLGAGIVVLLYLLDDKYKTAEDIRRYTGLTTFASVPVEDADDKKARRAYTRSRRE